MIVRGTQLSDLRLALPIAAAVTISPPAVESKYAPAMDSPVISVPLCVVAAPPAEPKERALTFESVVAWLAVQDSEIKDSCAAILADEVTRIYEAAKIEGFESGRNAGEISAQKDSEKLVGAFQALSAAAESAFALEQEQLQGICVEVIVEALAKIGGPLLSSEQAAIGAVKQVLARVKEARELTIRVAREDLELVNRRQQELSDALGGRKFEVVADARVELGGCLVETKLGSLDGRLEVQLRELYETLRLAKMTTMESP